MKNIYYSTLAKLSVLSMLVLPTTASAQISDAAGELFAAGQAAGVEGTASANLPELVGRFINAALSVLGIIFVILIVYAGFLWMTAGGNEDNVKKAKRLLAQSVVGIIIIVSAFAISVFVIDTLGTVTE